MNKSQYSVLSTEMEDIFLWKRRPRLPIWDFTCIPCEPLMKQAVLGQNSRRRRVNDDTGAAGGLAEDVLRHNYTQQLPNTVREFAVRA